jgi:predicted TIM-barrel fold metal-dependent hydrolase
MNNNITIFRCKRPLLLLFFIFPGIMGSGYAQDVNKLLLKNYRPQSLYKIPVTHVGRAKYPIIDMHSHEKFVKTPEDIQRWVKLMDQFNIEKTIIMSMSSGPRFDSIYRAFSKYGDRFEVWCGFDFTGYTEKGWSERAVKELERCYHVGAKGVGELGDKGLGEAFSFSGHAYGMHLDDIRLQPLYQKCGELKLPVNIHVSDPIWMYEPMDSTNDGLMNAYDWRIDRSDKNLLTHDQLIQTLENVVRENPKTTFIACHLANCEYDLSILGNLLDKYPNLYTDIGARYAETATIPRYMNVFFSRYQDRILYGTDMDITENMYETTLRVLETSDEHFYAIDLTGYHWPLQGFGLSDRILKKLYNSNARKIIDKSGKNN